MFHGVAMQVVPGLPWLVGLSLWLSSLGSGKIIHNHIDWKSSNGETMQYAIKLVNSDTINNSQVVNDLIEVGLVHTSPCLFIDNCHIFTHTYHFANGSCAFSNTTCAPAVKANKEHVHNRLDQLPDVVWYAEIWERHRFKRRVYFNDRNFTDQWHLVSLLTSDTVHCRMYKFNEPTNCSTVLCCSQLIYCTQQAMLPQKLVVKLIKQWVFLCVV